MRAHRGAINIDAINIYAFVCAVLNSIFDIVQTETTINQLTGYPKKQA
jgi:hypothetical protein